MTKHYTAKQAAAASGSNYHALRKQLDRDAKKLAKERKYPNARHCECGHTWLIPEKDLKIYPK